MTDVIERTVTIDMQDGNASGFFYKPATEGEYPAILHLTDIFGPRDATRAMAKRLSAEGFCVLQPHCFYRAGAAPLIDPVPPVTDERTLSKIKALFPHLTPAYMAMDIPVYLSFLERQTGVHKGAMGVVGYCYTGQMALRAAALCAGKIGAAASFHGGGLYTSAEDSPHLCLPQIQRVGTALYFGHAQTDKGMTEDDIKNLEDALNDWGGRFESETYADTLHGWTVEGRVAYNPQQAACAHAKLCSFLKETLTV